MDPLHIIIAMGPLSLYFLILALINLMPRGLAISGGLDIALLAFGLVGLVVAGPLELFWPDEAAARFGSIVWILLALLYCFGIVFIALSARPRIVVYNVRLEKLLPLLGQIAKNLDPEAQWAGSGLLLPNLGVQLHLEPFTALRNVQVVASGPGQNLAGWKKLRRALQNSIPHAASGPNPYGAILLGFSIALATILGYQLTAKLKEVAQAWRELRQLTESPPTEAE